MTLPSSPDPIKASQIQTEFGGANPIGLSEYYGSTGGTRSALAGGGIIKYSDFRGKSARFIYNVTFNSYYVDTNLFSYVVAAGWNQLVPVTINCTIGPSGVMYASGTNRYALMVYTYSWPPGSVLNLTNNGLILGRGGAGGAGYGYYIAYGTSPHGETGGPAMYFNIVTNMVNNGIIGGGGGGGGGGYDGDSSFAGGGGGGGGAGVLGGMGGPTISTYTYESTTGGDNPTYSMVSIDTGNRGGGNGGSGGGGAGGSGGSYAGYGNNRWGYGGGNGGGLGSPGTYFYSSYGEGIRSYNIGGAGYSWYGNQWLNSYTNNGVGSYYGPNANS